MSKCVLLLSLFLATAIHAQSIHKMNIIELDDYIVRSEKPLIVNFWATFCKPCVDEIPYFVSFIKNRYAGEVDLVLVSLDPKEFYPRKISSFAENQKFGAPIIWLNETNANYFCPKINVRWSGAIPATLMINNKKGVKRFYERQLTSLQFEKELRLLMEN
ncbi:MAG: TlpA disulfide reductase family protein [Chitinophagaceae bacterium]